MRLKAGSLWKQSIVTIHPASSLLQKTRDLKMPKSSKRYRLLLGMHIPEEVLGIKEICESEKDIGMQD